MRSQTPPGQTHGCATANAREGAGARGARLPAQPHTTNAASAHSSSASRQPTSSNYTAPPPPLSPPAHSSQATAHRPARALVVVPAGCGVWWCSLTASHAAGLISTRSLHVRRFGGSRVGGATVLANEPPCLSAHYPHPALPCLCHPASSYPLQQPPRAPSEVVPASSQRTACREQEVRQTLARMPPQDPLLATPATHVRNQPPLR